MTSTSFTLTPTKCVNQEQEYQVTNNAQFNGYIYQESSGAYCRASGESINIIHTLKGLMVAIDRDIGILIDHRIKAIHVEKLILGEIIDDYPKVIEFKYRVEYKKEKSPLLSAFQKLVIKIIKFAIQILLTPFTILAAAGYAIRYAAQRRSSPHSIPHHVHTLQWETEKAAVASLYAVANQADYQGLQEFANPVSQLFLSCRNLRTLIEKNDPKDLATLKSAYNACIAELRTVLNDPYYQDNKGDPFNLHVKFAHALCVAIWHHEPSDTQAYCTFGQKVQALRPVIENQTPLNNHSAKNHPLYKHYWTRESFSLTVMYALTHIRQAVAAQASLGGRKEQLAEKLSFLGFKAYDPMGSLSNHPTLHFESDRNHIRTRHMYGPTPTNHGQITPEFRGLLNAILLQQKARKQGDQYIEGTPDFLLYTNFQNFAAKGERGEGDRSRALMQLLNRRSYSDVARGISLSQDSSLFTMKGQDALKMWRSPLSFESRMRAHLFDAATYTYDNRQEAAYQAQGCYLPEGREYWEPTVNKILAEVTAFFTDVRPLPEAITADKAKEYSIAYQMLVYQLLQRVIEQQAGQHLKTLGIHDPLLHAQASCKEHVDRGGVNSAMHGTLSDRPTEETIGFLYGRPLAACDRMIIQHRLEPLALTKYITPQEYEELLERII